jgi:hypothetical protein
MKAEIHTDRHIAAGGDALVIGETSCTMPAQLYARQWLFVILLLPAVLAAAR